MAKICKVSIVYRMLPQYRVDFYERLRSTLAESGVDLRLLYGKNAGNAKKDEVDLSWATVVSQKEIKIGSKSAIFQRIPESIYESSLIVMVQENKLLTNFPLAWRARQRGLRLAFWGHGLNFQDNPESLPNRYKRRYSAMVDWWFAYTQKVAKLVSDLPFPEERITVVNNAIDTRRLVSSRAAVSEQDCRRIREDLQIDCGPVGIYCGSMYPEKRLPFLLKACDRVHRQFPKFKLIMIGAGPDAHLVEQFAASHEWVRYIGPKFGVDRVPYFAVSDVLLMPGLVGLAILDSFALGTPIITTKYRFHSPEIEYLEHERNGLMTDDDELSYAKAVIDALSNPARLHALRENARKDVEKYTVEGMVSNFAGGILGALESPILERRSRAKVATA